MLPSRSLLLFCVPPNLIFISEFFFLIYSDISHFTFSRCLSIYLLGSFICCKSVLSKFRFSDFFYFILKCRVTVFMWSDILVMFLLSVRTSFCFFFPHNSVIFPLPSQTSLLRRHLVCGRKSLFGARMSQDLSVALLFEGPASVFVMKGSEHGLNSWC